MFASSYMIVAMTVDRHHAICCPLQAYRGGAVSRWNTPVMVAWVLALILSIPQVGRSKHTCKPHFAHICTCPHKNTQWKGNKSSHPDFYCGAQDVGLFLAQWGQWSSTNARGNRQSCLWVCCLTASLCLVCQVFIFSRSEVAPGEYECWGNFAEPWGLKAYVTWMTVAVFLLPALIITICQVLVVLVGLSLHSSQKDTDYML